MWLVFAALSPLPAPLSAQAEIGPDTLRGRRDQGSAAALERARDAQEGFEDVRRRHLPVNSRWTSGPCDARIGRLCWRYHAVLQRRPRGEPPVVGEARDSLLAELARDASGAPGDPWILGQRVFYLLETGRLEEGRELAAECGGPPSWWCAALEGLACHVEGRYEEAERAFDRALEGMDPEDARRWEDVTDLVDGDGRDLLENAGERSPMARDSVVQRLWRLADPLYLIPGNERRTEHLARHTLIRIFSEAATPYGISWGEDMGEVLLRYGWERGWEQVPPRPGELGGVVRVVGYEHPDLRQFIPPGRVLTDSASMLQEPWTPFMWASAPSGYAPEYAPVFLPLRSRIIVLTRGARSLVAATFRLPEDTTYRAREGLRTLHFAPPALRGVPTQAGLVLVEPGGEVLHAAARNGVDRGVVMVDVPAGSYRASVEVVDPGAGRAGRLRNGLRVRDVPPDEPVLSDLLVVGGDSLPGTVEEALEGLRIDDEVVAGEPLVVGWELWGLGWREEVLRYRLSLEEADRGVLDRLRGLIGGERLPSLEWEEPGPEEPGAWFRSRSLGLPVLDPGDYELRLEVTLPGREALVSRQRIRIVESAGGEGGGGS